MPIIRRNRTWHYKKRVPKRFAHLDGREFARVSLHTDSEAEARRKAGEVEARLLAYWEALEAGRADDAAAQFDAAARIAAARGFAYRTAEEIAAAPLEDLVKRLEALAAAGRLASPTETAALLGEVERPRLTWSGVLPAFYDFTADRLQGKSEGQRKRWRLPRERAVANLVKVAGDKLVLETATEDAVAFRAWWWKRITEDGRDAGSANKDIGHLSDIFLTVCRMQGVARANPFSRMRFKEKGRTDVPAFSDKWIVERLLAPAALETLGEEARAVLLVMVNTGARPSEIAAARSSDFVLEAPIPFIRIAQHDGRTLKTDHSRREVPLLGVSLEAARVLAGLEARRYLNATNTWSAAVNKYLTEKKLRETPAHTAYSLRHSFQDRLIAVECPERIQAELMGHKLARPRYGEGATLEHKARWIKRIAF